MISFAKIVSDVEGAEKTFIGWAVKEYAILYKNEPAIEVAVDEATNYAMPALVIVLDMCGGAAVAPEVEAVVNEAVSDLKIASGLIHDFGPTPQAVDIAAAVQSNLQGLETAGHIKDPVTQAKFALIIKTVGVLATAIANAVAASKPVAAAA